MNNITYFYLNQKRAFIKLYFYKKTSTFKNTFYWFTKFSKFSKYICSSGRKEDIFYSNVLLKKKKYIDVKL